MELFLRFLRLADIFYCSGPGEEGHTVHTTGCVLAGHPGSIVRSGLWHHAVQSAVAGVCEGGQEVGRYRLDRHQSGAVNGIRGGAIGAVDLLSAKQRREEGRTEEVVLDGRPGHRGDIRR